MEKEAEKEKHEYDTEIMKILILCGEESLKTDDIKLEQNKELQLFGGTNAKQWKTRGRNKWKNNHSNEDILCVEQKLSKDENNYREEQSKCV